MEIRRIRVVRSRSEVVDCSDGGRFPAMGPRFQYLALLGICLVGTAFLEVRFQARVWRRPFTVLRALALPWLVFNAVNELAVFRHLWFYNPRYVTGWRVPRHYPVEEMCFFVAIPLCALLTFEAASNVYAGRVVPPWVRHGRQVPSPVVLPRRDVTRFRPAASAVVAVVSLLAAALLFAAALFEVRSDPIARAEARSSYERLAHRFDWNIREYPVLALGLLAGVLLLELGWWRTGIFRLRAFWSTMAICLAFMVPVNGWLTKLSAPVVIYASDEFSGLRPIWDIPLEDFGFGIALLLLVLMSWLRVTRRLEREDVVATGRVAEV